MFPVAHGRTLGPGDYHIRHAAWFALIAVPTCSARAHLRKVFHDERPPTLNSSVILAYNPQIAVHASMLVSLEDSWTWRRANPTSGLEHAQMGVMARRCY